MRLEPIDAARQILAARYPEAEAAIVGGSAVRGEGSPTSDLDLLMVIGSLASPFRESFTSHGWPVEVFVNNRQSWKGFFEANGRRRRPSLQQLCAEGAIILDGGRLATAITAEARRTLDAGPRPLEPSELEQMRYRVTDLLDDLAGAQTRTEAYFVATELVVPTVDLILAANCRWLARSKWIDGELRGLDPRLADQLTTALEQLFGSGERQGRVRWAEFVLAAVGGRLFEGFRQGRPPASS